MPRLSKNKQKTLKSTIKFLANTPNEKVARVVLSQAPDQVVQAIANCALNAQRNPSVVLSPSTRNLFRTYSKSFELLTDRHRSIDQKRKHLTQKGGAFPIVLPLLASALGSLGSAVISKLFNRDE